MEQPYRDAVVGHPPPAALADGGRVLQGGAGAVQHVQEDLPAVAAQHVADDLWPRLPRLLQEHRSAWSMQMSQINQLILSFDEVYKSLAS